MFMRKGCCKKKKGWGGGGVCLRERVSKNKIFYGPALGRGCFLKILVF